MRRCQELNSAAIQYLRRGCHEEARDLFREALEWRMNEGGGAGGGGPEPHVAVLRQSIIRCVTPDNPHSQRNTAGGGGNEITHEEGVDAARISDPSSDESHDSGPIPNRDATLLYQTPFEINEETIGMDTAAIVFNLALSYHLEDSSHWKARVFYEVSAVLKAM